MTNKILFILHLPPPVHGAAMVGKYIQDSRLVNDTFDCHFINLSASNRVDEVGKLSVRKIIFLFSNLWQVIRTVIKEKPDLCYLTPTSNMGAAFLRDFMMVTLLWLFRVKIVLHFHNKASESSANNRLYRMLCKSFFKGVKVILLGEDLYPEKAPYVKPESVYFCPNGILAVAKPKNATDKANPNTHFLFLSNMIQEKGVYTLLDACRILKQRDYPFRCDFVGAWKDISEEDFNTLLAEYNLINEVTAHGAKYGVEKVPFFEETDVFVFPSNDEVFPLVLLEAMDYSLPCITTRIGAIPSVIKEGNTGYCIEPKNMESLVNKMIWMIEHPEERVNMGIEGKKRFEERFTVEQFESNMVVILNECMI